jgi:zinc protease
MALLIRSSTPIAMLACALPLAWTALGCEKPSSSPTVAEVAPLPEKKPIYDPARYHRHRLDSGLELLLLEDPSAVIVRLGVQVRRGAFSVAPGRAGLAGLTNAMMRLGAGELDQQQLRSALAEASGALEIYVDWDGIRVELNGSPENLERLVELLADVVTRPQLPEEAASYLVDVIVGKLASAGNRPKQLQERAAKRVLYANHRAGLPLAGSEETLRALSAEDVHDFHAENFVPNNALFFASGPFDADEVLALAKQAFEAWPSAPTPALPPPLPAPTPPSRRVLVVDRAGLARNTLILLTHDGIARQSSDRAAAQILNEIIEERAIMTVQSEIETFRTGGSYALRTVAEVVKTRRIIDVLLAELERVRTRPVETSEFERARMRAFRRFSRSLMGPSAIFRTMIEHDRYELPNDSLDRYDDRIREATPESLHELAKRLLHPDRAAIIVVGSAKRLVDQLEGLGPIEVIEAPSKRAEAGENEAEDSDDETPPDDDDTTPAASSDPPTEAGS